MRTPGQITVFLSLILTLMISFLMALFQNAYIESSKSEARMASTMAMESVFGEYHKEALEQYDVFLLDGSYRSGSFSEEAILSHYSDFLSYQTDMGKDLKTLAATPVKWDGKPQESEITEMKLATDDGGRAFRIQVSDYMSQKLGIDLVQELTGTQETVADITSREESHDTAARENERELAELENQRQNAGAGTGESETADTSGETETEEEDPVKAARSARASPLLNSLLEHPENVSSKRIDLSKIISSRDLRQGFGSGELNESRNEILDNVLFREYVQQRAANYANTGEDDTRRLDYELEYTLIGKESDAENLKAVAARLLLIREAINFSYLISEQSKAAEAEAMAIALVGVLGIPPLVEAMKWGLLLAWAYGESVLDVRTLLAGGKVPIMKNAASWELPLQRLPKFFTEPFSVRRDKSSGVTYANYLKILFYLGNIENQTYRFMDLMEGRIRAMPGNEGFAMDGCVTRLTIQNQWAFSRDISYEFSVSQIYQ